MINRVYRLTERKKIEVFFSEEPFHKENVFVRPIFLAICAADQRYYRFERPKEILKEKIPMALIHEAIGEIAYDPLNEFKQGDRVILIPTIPLKQDNIIQENYLKTTLFRSSGYDGFMQELVNQPRQQIVKIPKEFPNEVMAFAELMSVALHAIRRFKEKAHERKTTIGVWGSGNLGLITSLFIKNLIPECKIYVFGRDRTKLEYFSFVDRTFLIDEDLKDIRLDHAFECVGGIGSQYAINQIIDLINPEGYIAMLGVSEDHVKINTRMSLEKGLTLVGNSRSSKDDYISMVNILQNNPDMIGYLKNLVSSIHKIKNVDDIYVAFETDRIKSWGKTIMKWEI